MALHLHRYQIVQLAGLVEYAVTDTELSDIMRQGRAFQEPAPLGPNFMLL